MMELSDQVFSPGMAYVALSREKQLENLHLIAFKPESVMVSTKCLREINRLRQTYRPDPSVSSAQQAPQTRKRSLSGSLLSFPPPPKQKKVHVVVSSGTKRNGNHRVMISSRPLKRKGTLLVVLIHDLKSQAVQV